MIYSLRLHGCADSGVGSPQALEQVFCPAPQLSAAAAAVLQCCCSAAAAGVPAGLRARQMALGSRGIAEQLPGHLQQRCFGLPQD